MGAGETLVLSTDELIGGVHDGVRRWPSITAACTRRSAPVIGF